MQIQPLPGNPARYPDLSDFECGGIYAFGEAPVTDFDLSRYGIERAKALPPYYTADKIREIASDPESYKQHRPAILEQVKHGPYTADRIKELSQDALVWADHKPFILSQLAHEDLINRNQPHRCNSCGSLKT